jgi:hypothetical protein
VVHLLILLPNPILDFLEVFQHRSFHTFPILNVELFQLHQAALAEQ